MLIGAVNSENDAVNNVTNHETGGSGDIYILCPINFRKFKVQENITDFGNRRILDFGGINIEYCTFEALSFFKKS